MTIRKPHPLGIALFIVMLMAAPGAGTSARLTDSLGREVAVPDSVDRIACMYAFTAHVTAMLGRADDIVAVSNGPQRDVLLTSMYPSLRNALVPKLHGAINIEKLVRTRPDIVFVAAETGRNTAEAAKLDACGLPQQTT